MFNRSLVPSNRVQRALVAVIAATLAGAAQAQVTERVSVAFDGAQAVFGGDLAGSDRLVSDDGRFIVFRSWSYNLVPGDTNVAPDVFVRDRLLRTTELISVDSIGIQGNDSSGIYGYAMSPDARYVVFYSQASNLVPGDVNNVPDVFLRDRATGTTELISVDSNGVQGNNRSEYPCVSADGRYVAFDSLATNLVPGDTNGVLDIFLRDRWTGQTQRVSVSSTGVQANGFSQGPSMSADCRYVTFSSMATNLVPGVIVGAPNCFVWDRVNGTQEIVNISTVGALPNGSSGFPEISDDGRFVCFDSQATNLVSGDTNSATDVFLHDRQTGVTELLSINSAGIQGNNTSGFARISGDGRFVSFFSTATNLDPTGSTLYGGFIRDRRTGVIERVTVSTAGVPALGSGGPYSVSSNGRYVVLLSDDANLVPGDTNNEFDIYVRDRWASGFTSLCDPGANNVIACPCGNPPSGTGRGCDNSSYSGGAALSGSGFAYLSMDSLAFTTRDEKSSATSILLQGDALLANGSVFGQGVRCVGGTMKRMYVKVAANGSITAPDFASGDPGISARSAQLGVSIQPGMPHYYLVYYRDPIVLGACNASSTFNATQTGAVSYWP